ncbi:diguanylate cyclase [uncultured Deefgea sp.]|uniref:sensor domain-containing diguanylate cyclase n=1 Tax=uncultured Deefgea sp. TaxID=1304914 RepID=UPI00262BF2DA|nr:diguanylate cyclase [uncultured Deefgea sp.]
MLPAPIPSNEDERMASLRKMLLLSTPDEEVFDRVVRMTKRVFNVPIVLVSLIDENRQWFKSCMGLPVRETGRDISFCGHAILGDDLFVIADARQDIRFADNPLVLDAPYVIFYAGRPLKNADGHNVGTLCIIDHVPRVLSDEERNCLHDLGSWVEQVFLTRELSESQQMMFAELCEVRRASLLDPLLNIWHRGAIMDVLKREMARAGRSHMPLALMMVDVDYFKQVNDQYGHPVGDQLLIEFVRMIKFCLRSYDHLGRYGGDEFIIVLPDIQHAHAVEKANAILLAIQNTPLLINQQTITMSASIGVATMPAETPCSACDLIQRADDALLRAKKQGRGRVEVAPAVANP